MQMLMPILIGGIVPAAICALGLIAISFIKPDILRKRLAPMTAPAIIGLAFLPVEYAAHGLPDLWPPDSTYRMAHIAIMATAFVVLGSLIPRPRSVHSILTFMPFPIAAWALLETLHPHYLTTTVLAAWIVAVGVVGWAGNLAMIRLARGSGLAPALLAMTLATGGLAACSMLGHSATIAQLGAGLAAISGGLLVAKLIRPGVRFSKGGFTVYLVLIMGLLALAHHFVELPIPATLLLTASPFSACVGRLRIIRSKKPSIRWIVTIGAAAAGPSLAAWITFASRSALPY